MSRRARIALLPPRALSTVQQCACLPFFAVCSALPQSAPSLTLLLLPSSFVLPPIPHLFLLLFSLLICCGSQLLVARPALPTIRPFTLLLLPSLPLVPSPLSHPSSTSFLSSSAAAAVDFSAAIPPPLVSPLIGAAADYSANFPPPLVSPLIGAAADYFAIFPPPLVSPRIGSAADYSATFPPLVSPLSGSAADYPALIPPPLIPFPTSALQLFPPPHGDLSRPPLPPSAGPSACARWHGFNLWFVTQQSGSGAIPTSPSGPTSSSSDPYADGLCAAIAETERLVTSAEATATAAPENAAARDLARILAESLESTREHLTEHLAAPSPRSASTPIFFSISL
ncbi:unnamed protein product [Closterium sp. NIES-65]|nr:unnamed protein product [Closterium sp. NIES-65]